MLGPYMDGWGPGKADAAEHAARPTADGRWRYRCCEFAYTVDAPPGACAGCGQRVVIMAGKLPA